MSHYPVYQTEAPSVPAGSHEMREYLSNHRDPPRSSAYTAPSITPYLGLRSRLSQIWINRWTVLLLLILARVLISTSGIDNNLASSKAQALSSCSNVESVGSAMASMPHFMSQGVNAMAVAGVEGAIELAAGLSNFAVAVVEEVVLLLVTVLVGFEICITKFILNGTSAVTVDLLDSANKALGTLTSSLGDGMGETVDTFQNAYNDVKNTLKTATLGLSSGISLPDLNLTDDIDKLKNLTLPPDLGQEITKLNNTLINFNTEVSDKLNYTDLIHRAFDALRIEINDGFNSINFNSSLLPVPAREQLTFCSDNDTINSFFDNLAGLVALAKKIFIAVLIILAVAACFPVAYYEIIRWRRMRRQAQLIDNNSRDPLDSIYIGSRPMTSATGVKFSNSVTSIRKQQLIRWVVAYATTEAALFILALAAAGLFSCLCQYILLKKVEQQVPAINNEVANFTNHVVNSLTNASQAWSQQLNGAIREHNASMNAKLVSPFDNLGSNITEFLTQFINGSHILFDGLLDGTPLNEPLQTFYGCLAEIAAQSTNITITNLLANSAINLPLIPDNVFSAGVNDSVSGSAAPDQSFLANPGSATADQLSNVVFTFVEHLKEALQVEATISACLLLIYFFVVFCAIVRALTLWRDHEKVRGEGGAAPTISNVCMPTTDFRSDNQDRFRAFDNVPIGVATSDAAPAPRYSAAIQEKTRGQTNWESDNKI